MSMRPAVATATGVLLGMCALSLSVAPAAQAAPLETDKSDPPLTVAHRGASGYAPENTLAAVDKADELGFDWVENDVQRTKDGKLVVLHDTTLDRTTDVEQVFPDRAPWKVSSFTAAEISKLDAGSWFDESFDGAKVPTFNQYLDRLDRNNQRLLLELKAPELYPGIEAETLDALKAKGWLDQEHVNNKLVVQSFNASSIKNVHTLKPAVQTGFLGTPEVSELSSYAKFSDYINPRYTQVTKDYVDAVHAEKGPHGRPVEAYTWTVNDGPTAEAAAAAGVDGIISNYPDVVRTATGG